MFGSFLPSLRSSINHSLLGSRSRHCYAIKWNSIVSHGGKGIHAGGDEPLHGVKQREDQKYYGVAVKEECQFAGDRMKRVALGIATNAEDIGNLDHNAEPE